MKIVSAHPEKIFPDEHGQLPASARANNPLFNGFLLTAKCECLSVSIRKSEFPDGNY
jgi:hypothetical protein